jgi:hypothetical protein
MLAGLYRALQQRRNRMLPALLLLAAGAAHGTDMEPVKTRFAELEELVHLTPERAQPLLDALEPQARRTPSEQGRLLVLSCDLTHRLGRHEESVRLCDQAEQIGRTAHDNDLVARALLSKA